MAEHKNISTGTMLGLAAVIVIALVAGIAFWILDPGHVDAEAIAERKDNKTQKIFDAATASVLPAELTAEFRFQKGSWTADGPVKDKAIIDLANGHKRLDSIYLNQSAVTSKGIEALYGHHVRSLEILDSDIDASITNAISKLEGLEVLYLKDSSVGDETLQALRGPESLTTIHFKNASLTAEGLKGLSKACPNISVLVFMGCTHLDDSALPYFFSFKKLKQLQLANTKVSPAGALKVTDTMPLATFGYRDSVNASQFVEAMHCPTVRELDLSGITLKDGSTANLAKMKQLKLLYLDDAQGLTSERLAFLKKQLPNCLIQTSAHIDSPEVGFFEKK